MREAKMIPQKRVLYIFLLISIGLLIGVCGTYLILKRDSNVISKENALHLKYIQTITLIRISSTLRDGEIEAARYSLEEALDSIIIFMTADAYEHTKSGEIARETIKMAAQHRNKYPFKANTPCINKMVENAFLVVNWDGHSPRQKQIQWNE